MSAPRNSLQAVLERQARPAAPQSPATLVAPPPAATDADQPAATGGKFFRPSRNGQKLIAGHFDPKVAKQLKLLAAEEETTVQALLGEALDLLFLKKGKGTIIGA
jgi:hypothetical protein